MIGRKRHAEGEQDFELNLASIIDCFTVLITYLLASASFISIGIMDVGLASHGTGSPDQAQPQLEVAVAIRGDRQIAVKLSGPETRTMIIPAKEGTWDFAAMGTELAAVHGRFPAANSALLAAQDAVEYKDIIRGIQVTRESFPDVSIGEPFSGGGGQ